MTTSPRFIPSAPAATLRFVLFSLSIVVPMLQASVAPAPPAGGGKRYNLIEVTASSGAVLPPRVFLRLTAY